MLKTWDDVKTFDDIILPRTRKLILSLERESKPKCPYLRKEGNFFYYCGANIPEIKSKEPEPFHPIYQNHIDTARMQLFCMDGFKKCGSYTEKPKI
ncbi:MAG: hypothetical protein V1802_01595 [Candidatus Aenigmatarchaeota archaeon]